jgi:hypothetical protein
MFFTAPTPVGIPGHVGYLAGGYRHGAYNDSWTDVQRCAERTFTAYVPGCSCGWYGSPHPATAAGQFAAHRMWLREHLAALPVGVEMLDRGAVS